MGPMSTIIAALSLLVAVKAASIPDPSSLPIILKPNVGQGSNPSSLDLLQNTGSPSLPSLVPQDIALLNTAASDDVMTDALPSSMDDVSGAIVDAANGALDKVTEIASEAMDKLVDVASEAKGQQTEVIEKIADLQPTSDDVAAGAGAEVNAADVIDDITDDIKDFVDDAAVEGIDDIMEPDGLTVQEIVDVDDDDDNKEKEINLDSVLDMVSSFNEDMGFVSSDDSSSDEDSSSDDSDGSVSDDRDDVSNIVSYDKDFLSEAYTDALDSLEDMSEESQDLSSDENSGVDDSKDRDDDNKSNFFNVPTLSSWLNRWSSRLGSDDKYDDSSDDDDSYSQSDEDDDDMNVLRYIGQVSKMKQYMNLLEAKVAGASAAITGTCPAYPVDIGADKVVITTQDGCRIIIKLKGALVESVNTFGGALTSSSWPLTKTVEVKYDSDD